MSDFDIDTDPAIILASRKRWQDSAVSWFQHAHELEAARAELERELDVRMSQLEESQGMIDRHVAEIDRLKGFVHIHAMTEIEGLRHDLDVVDGMYQRAHVKRNEAEAALRHAEEREQVAINRAEVAEVDRDELERTLEAVAMAMAGFTHNQEA
jgi:hypothetical protein